MTVIDLLKKHEGFSMHVYQATLSRRTIGYGYNIDDNRLHLSVFELDRLNRKGITEKTAENLLIDQVYKIKFALDKAIPWWSKISQARRDVLIDIAYSLGISGLLNFKNMLAFVLSGDYQKSADELLNSNWARRFQSRAEELAEIMRTGTN